MPEKKTDKEAAAGQQPEGREAKAPGPSFIDKCGEQGYPTYYNSFGSEDLSNPNEELDTVGFKEPNGDVRYQMMVTMPVKKWMELAESIIRKHTQTK